MLAREKRWIFALLSVVVATLSIFLLAEASLRWIFPPADFPGDRVLARRFHPHRQLRYTSAHGEFDVVSRYNSDGMRDRERSRSKPLGTRRILVIGDSFTEAKQVALDQTYASVLERQLSLTTPTEVINAGHSGFGAAEEFLVLKHFGISREPDLVIQGFFLNDVFEDLQALEGMELDARGVPVRLRGQRSEVFRLLDNSLRRLPFWWRSKVVERDWLGDFQRDPFAIARASVSNDDQQWTTTLRSIEAGAQLSRANGAGYLLVLMPLALQVDASHLDAVSNAYELEAEDLTDAPQRRLEAFCRERGIALLDLAPALARNNHRNLYFHHDGHWTPAGHEVAAQAIGEFLAAGSLALGAAKSAAVAEAF